MTRIVWIVTVGSVTDGCEFIKLKECGEAMVCEQCKSEGKTSREKQGGTEEK